MTATWMLVRRSLRLHRRSALALALVIALAGGLSLATAAAARRTSSAFTRFLETSEATDLAVGLVPEEGLDNLPAELLSETDAILEEARSIPGVERDATLIGLNTMFRAGPDGRASPVTPEAIGSLDGRYTEVDKVTLLEGRFPDPAREDEVLVNGFAVDRHDMPLGSRHQLVTIAGLERDEVVDVASAEVVDRVAVTVVGIGRFPEEVLRDEYDRDEVMLTTPALTRRYLEIGFPYRFHALDLRPGADVAAVLAAYEELSGEDYDLIVRRTDEQRTGAQLALGPLVVALAVFSALAGAATLALAGLGIVRTTVAVGTDLNLLRAVGFSRPALAASVVSPAVVGVLTGAGGAVALALALSPLAPVGPVREVEARRGLDLDAAAVLGGVGGLIAVLVVLALGVAVLVVRRHGGMGGRAPRASRFGSAVTAAGLGPAATVGLREALGLGGPRAGTPVRSTLASCALSVVAVVATLTFGASVDGLVDNPDRYGWAADRTFVAGLGYIPIPPEAAEAVSALPSVESVAPASYGSVQLGGRTASAVGLAAATAETAVTVLRGRVPATDDEVALGVKTAGLLGAGVGDRIRSDGGDVEVVGIVALPAIGISGLPHPSMAQGAVLTPDSLIARDGSALTAAVFVDFADGADETTATDEARLALADGIGVSPDAVADHAALRPAELVDVDPTKSTALALAAVLAGTAVLALAVTLGASVRRRRSQLAVLAALGLDQRDLRRSVRWQAGCVGALAVVAGVPLGLAAGRLSWQAFADQIGVAPTPVVPVALVAIVALAVVAVALLAAEGPARNAARTKPADALRPLT